MLNKSVKVTISGPNVLYGPLGSINIPDNTTITTEGAVVNDLGEELVVMLKNPFLGGSYISVLKNRIVNV